MHERDAQRLIVGALLLRVMAEANGGREPQTIWQYRRVARRFGVRLRFVAPDRLDQAMLRQGQRTGQQGVIYAPRTRNMARLRCWLIHELAEAAGRWEGWPPLCCQVSRHEAACCAVLLTV